MREDLDRIKIDENGDFNIEDLSTWGTRPIISILKGTATILHEKDDREVAIYLVEQALEVAKDFDACIYRLLNESMKKEKA